MTNLRCSVSNCSYNEDYLCDKSAIKVSGKHADSPKDTCCSSFHDSKGAAKNTSRIASLETTILCSAKNCLYNQHETCNASSIEVSGRGASKSEATLCSTFRE